MNIVITTGLGWPSGSIYKTRKEKTALPAQFSQQQPSIHGEGSEKEDLKLFQQDEGMAVLVA